MAGNGEERPVDTGVANAVDEDLGLAATVGEPRQGPAAVDTLDGHGGANLAHGTRGRDDPARRARRFKRGTHIGPFTVLAEVGAGGMGVVYSAYDPRLDRKVALKLLRPDDTSAEAASDGRRRLHREARALASLSHDNVVVVHETGEIDGQIYLAMEYVHGGTLRDWSRTQPRSWRETVAMYCRAGRGLLAAHEANLVHRDFKPENVLVGDDGRVRVTDFGLVRGNMGPAPSEAPDADPGLVPSAQPPFANTGVVGTPGYIAPEVLQLEPADARSDQYAFCVSLYEALYGHRPSEEELAGELSLSQRRYLPPSEKDVPTAIVALLRRGFAFEPDDRHESLGVLLDGLQPESGAAVTKRTLIGAVVLVGLVSVAAAVLLTPSGRPVSVCADVGAGLEGVWNRDRREQLSRAILSTDSALRRDTRDRTLLRLDLHAKRWLTMRRDACEATHVHHEQSEAALDLRMTCLDDRLTEFDAVISVLGRDTDDQTVRNAVKLSAGLAGLGVCADLDALKTQDPLPTDPAVVLRIKRLRTRLSATWSVYRAGKPSKALQMTVGDLDDARDLGWSATLASALATRAMILQELHETQEATKLVTEALPLAARAKNDLLVAELHLSLMELGAERKTKQKPTLSSAAIVEAAVSRAGDPPDLRIKYQSGLGRAYDRAGDYKEALKYYRSALELANTEFGSGDLRAAVAMNNIAAVLDIQGQRREALAMYETVLTMQREAYGDHHPDVARTLNNMAIVLSVVGDKAGAIERYRGALTIWRGSYGDRYALAGVTLLNMGVVLQEQEQWKAAENAYRQAMSTWENSDGRHGDYLGTAWNNLGDLYEEQGDCQRAAVSYGRALEIWESSLGANHPDLAYALEGVGSCLIADKRLASAVAPLERAVALRTKAGVDPNSIADVRFLLARALHRPGGDRQRAVSLANAALAQFREPGGNEGQQAGRLKAVRAWLASHHR